MRESEIIRYNNTTNDLLSLGVDNYCDLGPGRGEIAIEIKKKGKNICCLEAPWDFEQRTAWSKEHDIKVFKGAYLKK